MPGTARLTRHDDVALIELDHPPVNALSHGLREGLAARDGMDPPRVAGARALQQRERALREGLSLPAAVCEALVRAAAQWGVPAPPGIAGLAR